jgi:L-ascorbate metabolism protein UlaG (beta-lactamase superfamily)
MGSILDFEPGNGQRRLRIYITGDTLVFDDIREIPQRYPDVDIALLHLGGTMILGLLLTMDGKQGVEMLNIIRPKTAIPIHYNDYDVFKSPLADFLAEAEAAGWRDRVHVLHHGETYAIA